MPDSRTIWRRRTLLMLAFGLLVAIPVTVAVRSGGDGSSEPPVVEPAPLGNPVFDRKLGIEYRVPRSWRARSRQGILRLVNRRRGIAIAISTPGPRADAKAIEQQALGAIAEQYERVKVLTRFEHEPIGGLRAGGGVLAARAQGGGELRILALAAPGEKLTYLVEVFVSAGNPAAALVEAQKLLNELTFRG